MKVKLPGGDIVEAWALTEQVGQFTHWYKNRNGEPRFLVIRQANGKTFMLDDDVSKALTAAMSSGRYMVAVFVIDTPEDGGDQLCYLHRVTRNFPHDAFDFCKTELAKNLDSEYLPPAKLKLADFVAQGMPEGAVPVTEDGRRITITEKTIADLPEGIREQAISVTPVGQARAIGSASDIEQARLRKLADQLKAMNAQAEAEGLISEPQKASDEAVLVPFDPAENHRG